MHRISSKKETYSLSISPQETRKISNREANRTLKTTREKRTKKTKSLQREKIKEDQRKDNHLGFIIIIYEYSHGIIL